MADGTRKVRLDRLHIPKPCAVAWTDMTGDERARACDACGKVVRNLSAMTEEDAAAWLASETRRGGEICARIDSDELGRWSFAPPATTAPRDAGPARRVLTAVGGTALMLAAACTDGSVRPGPADAAVAPAPTGSAATATSTAATAATSSDESVADAGATHAAGGARRTTIGCVCVAGDPLCSCL